MLLSRAQEANGGGRINQEGEKASAAATLQGLQLIIKNNKRKRLLAMTKQASIRIADVVVVLMARRHHQEERDEERLLSTRRTMS